MKCPLCLSSDVVGGLEWFEGYSLHCCKRCDLMWWEPFKAASPEFYERLQVLRNIYDFADELSWDHRYFLAHPPRYGGELLDVGCGSGRFLAEAQKLGFKVTGTDFDVTAVESAKTRYGIADVHAMSLEVFAQEFRERKFDVITCFAILEHVDDIKGFLATTKSLLKPGGYIVISTPNRERWVKPKPIPFHETGSIGDYPPVHLTRWNKRCLENALSAGGFADINIYVSPFGFSEARDFITKKTPFVFTAHGWAVSALKRSKNLTGIQSSETKRKVLGQLLLLAKRLRRMLLFLPSLPVVLYGQAFDKEGCYLYATAINPV